MEVTGASRATFPLASFFGALVVPRPRLPTTIFPSTAYRQHGLDGAEVDAATGRPKLVREFVACVAPNLDGNIIVIIIIYFVLFSFLFLFSLLLGACRIGACAVQVCLKRPVTEDGEGKLEVSWRETYVHTTYGFVASHDR